MQLNLGARFFARFLVCTLALAGLAAPHAQAADTELTIEIKDHKFSPSEFKVPAGQPIKLTVKNLDATAEEFESHPLHVEKVIAGNATATVRIKALEKGTYKFVGEYHEDTAKGTLVAE
jgi:plastocyanin